MTGRHRGAPESSVGGRPGATRAAVRPMTAAPAQEVALVTAADLLERSSDEQCVELVDGVLTPVPPAGARHGRTAARSLLRNGARAEATGAGEVLVAETGFLLAGGPGTVRAPDVAVVAADRVPGLDVAGFARVVLVGRRLAGMTAAPAAQ